MIHRLAEIEVQSTGPDRLGHLSLAGLSINVDRDLMVDPAGWPPQYSGFIKESPGRPSHEALISGNSPSSSLPDRLTSRIVPGVESDRPDSRCFEVTFSSDCWDWGRWGSRRCFRFHAGPDRPYLWLEPEPDYRLAQVWPDDGLPGRRRINHHWTMPPLSYPVDRVLWMGALAHHEGVIVHACGWSLNGRSVLCPGVSGAGKSTLARQIVAMGQGTVLSDDRVVVRGAPDGFMAWGTPWPGEGRQSDPSGAPLVGIAFIEQATENALTPLSPADALRRLFATASVPWYDPDLRDRVLPLLERLVNTVPAWRFRCRPEPDAAVLLRERMG